VRAAQIAVAASALFLLGALAAVAAPPAIGINYDWWKLSTVSLKQCRTDGSARDVGQWFLPFYQMASVRATVRQQLRAMRGSGFATLRLLVFYYHSTDASSEDSFNSTDGSISQTDRAKLHDFITDVAAAGFRRIEVVPSFQAENWLYCRNRVWGDCFDPSRIEENWRFIRETARTAIGAAPGLDLRFDLANEAAPDPTMTPHTLANAKRYLQTIAGRFQREFGGAWTVSTARSEGSPASETASRLDLLLADLGQAGVVPKFLELHAYSEDGNDLTLSLDTLDAVAARIGAAEILGELRYHSSVQAAAIAAWLRRHPSAKMADVIQWPEYDPTLVCARLPAPPYVPGPYSAIDEGIGGR
jgi:hypothetical protein